MCEPLELTQEFRRFDLSSPWEQFPAHRPASAIPAAAAASASMEESSKQQTQPPEKK